MRVAPSLHRSQMELVFGLPPHFTPCTHPLTKHWGVGVEIQDQSRQVLKGKGASDFFRIIVMKFILSEKEIWLAILYKI